MCDGMIEGLRFGKEFARRTPREQTYISVHTDTDNMDLLITERLYSSTTDALTIGDVQAEDWQEIPEYDLNLAEALGAITEGRTVERKWAKNYAYPQLRMKCCHARQAGRSGTAAERRPGGHGRQSMTDSRSKEKAGKKPAEDGKIVRDTDGLTDYEGGGMGPMLYTHGIGAFYSRSPHETDPMRPWVEAAFGSTAPMSPSCERALEREVAEARAADEADRRALHLAEALFIGSLVLTAVNIVLFIVR